MKISMNDTRRQCFNQGKAWFLALPPEGRETLDKQLIKDDLLAYLLEQAKEVAHPIDFVFGVSTSIECIEGLEELYA